ncbi:acyl-CoA synthetase [Nocardia beijingensis]|uniref:acyl-CoA synthetase n=1 Tax=Nocardia beijingensis TaxID=95162 RepID=UPI00082CF69A|nr:acyl-CoA synthetase [Nocardia beijingensis]
MANNFADLFEHSVDAMPERVALVQSGRRVTYRELDVRANRLAHHLASVGVGAGTHVGFQMHNSVETMETLIACFKLAAVPININYRYGVAELAYVYDNADLQVLVHHSCYGEAVREARQRTPGLRHTIRVADEFTPEVDDAAATPYESALAAGAPDRPVVERSADDLFMMYTGGTTGMPKGVMWRQEDMWRVLGGGIDFYTGEPVADEFQQSRTGAQVDPSAWLVLPPLIHAAAMMPTFTALWSGNTVIFESRFDAARVWRTVAEQRPQVMVITGDAMAKPLIEAYRSEPVDASSLLAIASGAALLSQPVKNTLLEMFSWAVVSDSIGSSETGFGGIGFAQKDDDPARGPRVRTGRGAVVVDDDGRPVAPGAEGWLAKTGNVPIGYYKDPGKTERLFKTVDGLRMVVTDDRARAETDGSITLIGRGNMVINTGGEKVFVEEVESVVKAHDAIFDAVVVGVPHERWGHQVAAVVSLAGPGPVEFTELHAHVRRFLAGYKVPKQIWVADAIVRAPSGKPDYRWAKQYVAGRGPDHKAD